MSIYIPTLYVDVIPSLDTDFGITDVCMMASQGVIYFGPTDMASSIIFTATKQNAPIKVMALQYNTKICTQVSWPILVRVASRALEI